MKRIHKGTVIKELDSNTLDELNPYDVYQVEWVGKGDYNVNRPGVGWIEQNLNQYLVEYKEATE